MFIPGTLAGLECVTIQQQVAVASPNKVGLVGPEVGPRGFDVIVCWLMLCCRVQMVANSRSSEAFVAACLLTVGGSSLLTKQLGLSDTLGAFVAGVLLAETSFRTQVRSTACEGGVAWGLGWRLPACWDSR